MSQTTPVYIKHAPALQHLLQAFNHFFGDLQVKTPWLQPG